MTAISLKYYLLGQQQLPLYDINRQKPLRDIDVTSAVAPVKGLTKGAVEGSHPMGTPACSEGGVSNEADEEFPALAAPLFPAARAHALLRQGQGGKGRFMGRFRCSFRALSLSRYIHPNSEYDKEQLPGQPSLARRLSKIFRRNMMTLHAKGCLRFISRGPRGGSVSNILRRVKRYLYYFRKGTEGPSRRAEARIYTVSIGLAAHVYGYHL
ncbi:hypothetical protein EVAR_79321_1 [Eumeta japonica]|uniref:Uncharacterized protein n=1 Tax=Eumeta variegata TaxID=151549 RepID=A0A4C1TFV5_EUMVA|nr:hypothetical protein EVAR_79321_1 [Eumeta japonica]